MACSSDDRGTRSSTGHPKVLAYPTSMGLLHFPTLSEPKNGTRPRCPGGAAARFRQNTNKVSNALRLSIGMPVIEAHGHGFDRHRLHHHHDGEPEGMGGHPNFHDYDDEVEKGKREQMERVMSITFKFPASLPL
ncbi:hypothetical protein GYMLUDRAFT_239279 [Collybiopsis luxurians FD-317 M1]|nr:hypothetical protein GYMLUDRAFT_239279 [Collybiopsis luxurians FD-317 M1]